MAPGIEWVNLRCYLDMKTKLPPAPTPTVKKFIGIYPVDRIESFMGNSNFNRWLPDIYKSYYERRQAAVYLAARLYQADHGAALQSLAQLVPNYLERIPDDPIAGPPG